MKQFAVIGSPISHSLSPNLHEEIFRQLNVNASYSRLEILPINLGNFFLNNELDGFNVTIPHKISIMNHLRDLDTTAEKISAVNCVHNNIGYNTDWVGFLHAMKLNNVILKNKDCLIIGSGGAKTLPVATAELVQPVKIQWGSIMAAGVITTAPMMFLGLLIRRYLVTGLTMGAVRE